MQIKQLIIISLCSRDLTAINSANLLNNGQL
jgi:hypothetical protein